MPPTNQQRRNDLSDAAIEIVARDGLHGLSHRAVDEEAEVPRGTTSNYFRSRDALLEAAARRVIELHIALIAQLRTEHAGALDQQSVIDLLSGVVDESLSRHRSRYLAMFELALESTRRPGLREAFGTTADEAMKLTHEVHRGSDGDPPREDVELLGAFYNGVLFTSLVMPQALGDRSPGEITRTVLGKVLEPAGRRKRAE